MAEDRHEPQILELVSHLASSAPPAPAFSRIAEQLARRAERERAAVPANGLEVTDISDHASAPPAYVRDRALDQPRHSKPWRLMAALVALGMATAGGVFAYGSLTAEDGTASPEQAVKHFVGAFEASDAAGMLETLPANERVVLRESLESLNHEGGRLRLTKDLNLNNVSGVHLRVTGLQLSTTGLSTNVATVHLKGTLHSTANDRQLPIGQAARDLLADSVSKRGYQGVADAVDKSINENTSHGKSIELVTVKDAGGWHVSVWYSLAEYLRVNDGARLPNFDHSPIKPVGGGTPEAVVRSLMAAGTDYARMVALATPDESEVLYDYVPVLLAKSGTHTTTRTVVHRLGTHVDGGGDRRTVHIDSYDLQVTSTYPGSAGDGRPDTFSTSTYRTKFDGNCFTTRSTSSDPTVDNGDPHPLRSCRKEALAKGTTPLQWDLLTKQQFTVERHGGRWYISPVRSVVDDTVSRLAQVPDARTFKKLASDQNTSAGFLLLPLRTYATFLGSPEELGILALPSSVSSSSSSTSSGSGTATYGPVPTTSLGPITPPVSATTRVPPISAPAPLPAPGGASSSSAPATGKVQATAPPTIAP